MKQATHTESLRVTTTETLCRMIFGSVRHDVSYVTSQLRQIPGFLAAVEKACKIDVLLSCSDSSLESQCREDDIEPIEPDFYPLVALIERYDSALASVCMTDDELAESNND